MKAAALGLTLALGIVAIGGASPKKAEASTAPALVSKEIADSNGWQLDGGWTIVDDHTVTDKIRQIVSDAKMNILGVSHKPIAYLGYQIVAGTNYCVLCKRGAVIPNPVYTYELMYIYEDLNGVCRITGAKIVNISDFAEYVDPTELVELKLNKTDIKIKKGKKKTLKATVSHSTDDSPVFIWRSSDKKVATVKNGVITAKKKGSCVISCAIKGLPDTTRICYVTVKK